MTLRYWIELALNNAAALYLNYLVLSTVVFSALLILPRLGRVAPAVESRLLRASVVLLPLLAGLRVASAHTGLRLPGGRAAASVAGPWGWTAIAVVMVSLATGWALTFRLARRSRQERLRLGSRTDVPGPTRRQIGRLLGRSVDALPRITQSTAIRAPVAIGSGEICLPPSIIQTLEPQSLRAVMVHELSHVDRRDGRWIVLAHLLERLFLLQPLHRGVARRIRETSEFVADDRSVAVCGTPEPLVEALVTFARVEAPGSGMAGFAPGSLLYRRVRRVLGADSHDRSWRSWTAAIYFLAVLTLAWCMPSITPACDCLVRLILPGLS